MLSVFFPESEPEDGVDLEGGAVVSDGGAVVSGGSVTRISRMTITVSGGRVSYTVFVVWMAEIRVLRQQKKPPVKPENTSTSAQRAARVLFFMGSASFH